MYYYVNYLGLGQWRDHWWQLNVPPSRPISMALRVHWSNTDGIAQCGMSMATLEATGCRHQADTLSVLRGGHRGDSKQNNDGKMYHHCRPFWWPPRRFAGTIPHTSSNRGGPGLQRKPLVDTTKQVLWPIVAIGHTYAAFFRVFSSSTCYKRAQVDVKAPNNYMGMTEDEQYWWWSIPRLFMGARWAPALHLLVVLAVCVIWLTTVCP